MNKSDLVDAVATSADITKASAGRAVDAVLDSIGEALGKLYGRGIFESYSAGTEIKPRINQDAVRIIKEKYNIDMEKNQKSKLISDIPEVDIVITMGCNVNCPYLPCNHNYSYYLALG